jgi:uncharacterized protein YndB with AHSA1/START domain
MNTSVTHETFTIERVYPVAPQRVFAAFADPSLKRRWFDGEHVIPEESSSDFRPGGSERKTFRIPKGGPAPNMVCTNRTTYLDIIPGERIVFAYTMSFGENPFSASLATVQLIPSPEGSTKLIFTEQGAFFAGSDGAPMRRDGWRQLLDSLARELAS